MATYFQFKTKPKDTANLHSPMKVMLLTLENVIQTSAFLIVLVRYGNKQENS